MSWAIDAPFQASDLGPADDPDEDRMNRLEEDEDFCVSFVTAHCFDIIEMITAPDRDTKFSAAQLRKLLYEREHDEVSERRASSV